MVFLVIPFVSFVVVNIAFFTYIYRIQNLDDMKFPVVNEGARHIFILAHGLGDTASKWADPLKYSLEKKQEKSVQVISLDWNPYSQSLFRCSIDGKRIGEKIAGQLNTSSSLKTVHLIGHSCGSFVVLGMCRAIKEARPDIIVQTTFLDPVAIYGGLFWKYGILHFGSCGDFSEAYIDTEDGVPGSNQLLPNTHTFNVTAVRKASNFKKNPHVWPTLYYQQLVKAGNMLEYRKDRSIVLTYPKGVMSDVKP